MHHSLAANQLGCQTSRQHPGTNFLKPTAGQAAINIKTMMAQQ
jgi:hypothetical protein